MNPWLLTLPLISGVIGWLLHKLAVRYIVNNYLPKKHSQFAKAAAAWIPDLISSANIESKISDPAVIEKAMPMIEAHIDTFLSEKLPQEIPMLGMFIGNKTTDKIKAIFVSQVKQLFPIVMTQLWANTKETLSLEKQIAAKLDEPAVQQNIRKKTSEQLAHLPILGFITGLIIGLANLLLIFFLTLI